MSFGFSVGDFIAVGELAFEFQLVTNELSNLSNSIKILQNEVDDPKSTLVQAGEDRVRMVNGMMTEIKYTLNALENVAKKYEILGSASRGKQIWVRFKWSTELASIDKLRGKRIESTNTALAKDISIIKSLIAGREVNTIIPASTSPLGLEGDDILLERLNVKLMKDAEVDQPWSTIGIAQWVACARWWLLVAQLELADVTEVAHEAPLSAYTNLVKTSWILINMIAPHPQIAFTTATTQADVRLLSTELKGEFSKLNSQNTGTPSLENVEKQELQVWERQTSDSIALPVKAQNAANMWRLDGDEEVLFQSYGSYKREALTEPLPCLILLLIARDCRSARLVAQSQNGVCILVYSFEQDSDLALEGTWAFLGYAREPGLIYNRTYRRYRISFIDERATKLFSCFFKAISFYLFEQNAETPSPADLPAYATLFAVKDMDIDIAQRLKKRIAPSISRSGVDGAGHIASTLADHLLDPEGDGSIMKDIPPHVTPTDSLRPTSKLFVWAAYNGLVSLMKLMITNRIEWTVLKFPDSQGYESHHSRVFRMINCCKNVAVTEILLQDYRQTHEIKEIEGTDIVEAAELRLHRSVEMFLGRLRPQNYEDLNIARSVLFAAIKARQIFVLENMIRAGFDIETREVSSGNTLLMLAVMLSTRVADDTYDSHHALAKQDYKFISLLLAKGASTAAENKQGLTSAHIATMQNVPYKIHGLVWHNYTGLGDHARLSPNEKGSKQRSKITIMLPNHLSMTIWIFLESHQATFIGGSPGPLISFGSLNRHSVKLEFPFKIAAKNSPISLELYVIYPSFLESLSFSVLHSRSGDVEVFPSPMPFSTSTGKSTGEGICLAMANGGSFHIYETTGKLQRFQPIRTDPNAEIFNERVHNDLLPVNLHNAEDSSESE